MMNKSGIEWCDFTWNPITGCRTGCPYCYAARQARRFQGDLRMNKISGQLKEVGEGLWELDKPFHGASGRVLPLPAGFEPTMHRYRLDLPRQKKKPGILFVGAMADIFGDWVPDEWINDVFEACAAAPQHQYLFLTKNPYRYSMLERAGQLPRSSNMWYGNTINTIGQVPWACEGYQTFTSIEPIMTGFPEVSAIYDTPSWIIVGAETGPRKGKVIPAPAWIDEIEQLCRKHEIPLFMKNNLSSSRAGRLVQEWPAGMKLEYKKPLPKTRRYVSCIRDHKQCIECGADLKGKPAMRMANRYNMCMSCYEIRIEGED